MIKKTHFKWDKNEVLYRYWIIKSILSHDKNWITFALPIIVMYCLIFYDQHCLSPSVCNVKLVHVFNESGLNYQYLHVHLKIQCKCIEHIVRLNPARPLHLLSDRKFKK